MLNVCVIGHGMTGIWHSNALRKLDCRFHTLVGRRPGPTREFAERYGYLRWTTDPVEALSDGDIDLVIVASPSELHVEQARLALEHGRDTLVEIPLAMSLEGARELVEIASERRRLLGVVHPLRFRPEMVALRERSKARRERVRQVSGRFFIHRLENIGATGYRRSWTDNLLWHHMAHLVDFGVWVLAAKVHRVHGFMPPVDPATGIPMDAFVALQTDKDQSLVCAGSYYGRERIFEVLVVTDRDSYRLDVPGSRLTTGSGSARVASEEETCALVAADFLSAVAEGHEPCVPGAEVLRTMAVLQEVQDAWDRRHGRTALPGRPLR